MSFYDFVVKSNSKNMNKKLIEEKKLFGTQRVIDINSYILNKNNLENITNYKENKDNNNNYNNSFLKLKVEKGNNSNNNNNINSLKQEFIINKFIDVDNKNNAKTKLENINDFFLKEHDTNTNKEIIYNKNHSSKFAFTSRNNNEARREEFEYKIIPYKNKKIIGVFPKIINNKVDINKSINQKINNEVFPKMKQLLNKPTKVSKDDTNSMYNFTNINASNIIESKEKLNVNFDNERDIVEENKECNINLYVPEIKKPIVFKDKYKDVIIPSYTRKYCSKKMCKFVYDLKKMSKISLSKLKCKLYTINEKKSAFRKSIKLNKKQKIKWGERLTLLLSLSNTENIKSNYSKIVQSFKQNFYDSLNSNFIDENLEFEKSIKEEVKFNEDKKLKIENNTIYITGVNNISSQKSEKMFKKDDILNRFKIDRNNFQEIDKYMFSHDDLEIVVNDNLLRITSMNDKKQRNIINKKTMTNLNNIKFPTEKEQMLKNISILDNQTNNYDNISINSNFSLASFLDEEGDIPSSKIKSHIKNNFKLQNLDIYHLDNQFKKYFKDYGKEVLFHPKNNKNIKKISIPKKEHNINKKIDFEHNKSEKILNKRYIPFINKSTASKIHYIK